MLVLSVKNLKVSFPAPGGIVRAVDQVDLSLHAHEKVALIGESGCGKTVLAHSFLRLLHKTTHISGEVSFRGVDLLTTDNATLQEIRGKNVGMIMQNAGLSLDPVLTIGEQISEVCIERCGMQKEAANEYTVNLLRYVGFPNPEKIALLYPHQLSGGMAQRAMIALGIIQKPELLIADEPTKALDEKSRMSIVELLSEVSSGKTLLMITHDLHAAESVADRILVMYAGELVEEGSVQQIFEEPVHPYTKGFLDAQPRKGLHAIPGISPSLLDLPQGCRFHPRCTQAQPECTSMHPEFHGGNSHLVRCHLCQ